MRNLRSRLNRLEKRRVGPSFTFLDLISGHQPPPGWELPPDIAEDIAKLSDLDPDIVEKKIHSVD